MPCNYYNQDSCVHDKTHETKGTIYKHICSACFANGGKSFTHPETQCRNKNKKVKKRVSQCLYPWVQCFEKLLSNQVCLCKKCRKLGVFWGKVCHQAGLARLVLQFQN